MMARSLEMKDSLDLFPMQRTFSGFLSRPASPSRVPDRVERSRRQSRADIIKLGSNHEDRLSLLKLEVEKHGPKDLLENFTNEFVNGLLSNGIKQKNASQAKRVFQDLRQCALTYDLLHELESNMNETAFKKFMFAGFVVFSDSVRGERVIWIDVGSLMRGSWNYMVGTPKSNALVRWLLFTLQCLLVQSSPDSFYTACLDFTASVRSDFNPAVLKQIVSLSSGLAASNRDHNLFLFGMSRVTNCIFRLLKNTFREEVTKAWMTVQPNEVKRTLLSIGGDLSNVPAWFSSDGTGLRFNRYDRRQTWSYERCLDKNDKITCREVMRPGPWPFPPCTVGPSGSTEDDFTKQERISSGRLSCIMEAEEEE